MIVARRGPRRHAGQAAATRPAFEPLEPPLSMIRVLWQSDHCLVVFKPAGLPTQAPAAYESLESRLRDQRAAATGDDGKPPYLALPHRLDRAVSGVILVALTKRAARLLGQQFQSRKIAKTYLAWVQGQVADETATWSDRLVKVPEQARVEVVPPPVGETPTAPPGLANSATAADAPALADPRAALTTMRVLRRQGNATLLELRPLTGRMHQLRVQAAHRGHPILGDSLYGSTAPWGCEATAGESATIALHAWQVGFHDPRSGRWVSAEAPPDWPAEHLP